MELPRILIDRRNLHFLELDGVFLITHLYFHSNAFFQVYPKSETLEVKLNLSTCPLLGLIEAKTECYNVSFLNSDLGKEKLKVKREATLEKYTNHNIKVVLKELSRKAKLFVKTMKEVPNMYELNFTVILLLNGKDRIDMMNSVSAKALFFRQRRVF